MAIPDATLLIGGLDVLTAGVIGQFPEVQFRLQTFRHQNNVGHVPTQEKAMSLGQMLQAELQILEHATPNKKSKLARLQEGNPEVPGEGSGGKAGQKGDKGKGGGKKVGKDTGGDTKACYHWMSKGGCRMGRECKFRHDKTALTSAPDVSSRCFVCSGVGHRAAECPTSTAPGGSNQRSSQDGDKAGVKGAGKATSKGSGLKRVEEEKPCDSEQAKLLSAATTLIQQMQAKALGERPSMYRLQGEGKKAGLIDSGASACLRQTKGDEPKGLARRTVDLAQGSVELYATPCGTLVSEEPVETIVALGPLIKMGCRLQWEETGCALWHPSRGRLRLEVDTGCPRIAEHLALQLIEEIEEFRVGVVGAALRAIRAQQEQGKRYFPCGPRFQLLCFRTSQVGRSKTCRRLSSIDGSGEP